MTEFHYPNETAAYRAARDALLKEEQALRAQVDAVARQRRQLPDGGALKEAYEFERPGEDGQGVRVAFKELFEGKHTLILHTMMFGAEWDAPCPSCTSIVDAMNTAGRTIRETAAIAVVAQATPAQMQTWGGRRAWSNLALYSGTNSPYLLDYAGFMADDPGQVSVMNVFRRRGDAIVHFWGSELVSHPMDNGHPRHVDMIWPLWNLMDLTPDGRGERMVPEQDFEHAYFSEHILGQ